MAGVDLDVGSRLSAVDQLRELAGQIHPTADAMSRRVEYLGDYPTVDEYFKSQLEDLVLPAGLWLLDCLDPTLVREWFEAGTYCYFVNRGCVFRVTNDE